jgi:hypothetical protein
MLNSNFSLNSTKERKNNKKYKCSKPIIKSLYIFLIFILYLFIKYVDEKKINLNSPLFPLEFKCSKNKNLKSLIFEIKNKSNINLTY